MGISLQLEQKFTPALAPGASVLQHSSFILALRREKVLSALGLRILRFGNDEVMRGLSVVVGKIKESVRQ